MACCHNVTQISLIGSVIAIIAKEATEAVYFCWRQWNRGYSLGEFRDTERKKTASLTKNWIINYETIFYSHFVHTDCFLNNRGSTENWMSWSNSGTLNRSSIARSGHISEKKRMKVSGNCSSSPSIYFWENSLISQNCAIGLVRIYEFRIFGSKHAQSKKEKEKFEHFRAFFGHKTKKIQCFLTEALALSTKNADSKSVGF